MKPSPRPAPSLPCQVLLRACCALPPTLCLCPGRLAAVARRYRDAHSAVPRNATWRSHAPVPAPPRRLGVSASLPTLLAAADLRNGTPPPPTSPAIPERFEPASCLAGTPLSRLPSGLTMALSHAGPPKPAPPHASSTALAGAVQQRLTQCRMHRRMDGLQHAKPFPLTERVTRALSSNAFSRHDDGVLKPSSALDQVTLDRRRAQSISTASTPGTADAARLPDRRKAVAVPY